MKQYPVIKLNLLFITGIIVQEFFNIQLPILISFFAILTLFSVTSYYFKNNLLPLLLFILTITSGSLSYYLAQSQLKHYPFRETKLKNAEVFGTIVQIQPPGSYELKFRIHADSVYVNKRMISINHDFLCRIRDNVNKLKLLSEKIAPGNYLSLSGTILRASDQRNPGEFNYYNYLYRENISALFTTYYSENVNIVNSGRSEFKSIIFNIQKSISQTLEQLLNNDAEALLKGLILADRSGIDPETTEDFINTGVIHILSVSGLHIGYIVLIFIFLTGRIIFIYRVPLIFAGIIIYTALTGAPPSVLRAAFMSIVVLIALLSNRSTNLLNILSLACLLFLIDNPLDLFHPGFQLSYISVGGIGLFLNYFGEYFKKLAAVHKVIARTAVFFLISIFAQAGTIPFTIYYFDKVSVVSLLVNIFVIPATGAILGSAVFMLFINIVWTAGGAIYASAINFLVYILYSVVHLFSTNECSYLYIRQFSVIDGVIFYIFTVLLIYLLSKFKNNAFRLIVIPFVILNLVFCSGIDNKNIFPENKLSIIAIDVGQGDAFLIKLPNGKTALIDAGEATEYLDNGKRVIIPLMDYFNVPRIDYGFISHMDVDHYEGFISLVLNQRINKIFKPLPGIEFDKQMLFEEWLKSNNVTVQHYTESIIKEGNTAIYLLKKPWNFASLSVNDKSAVIKIVYGNCSILFTGDTERKGEKYLIETYGKFLKSDILKLGHHGSRNSSGEEFLDVVQPSFALISAGRDNRFNHPSNEILHRLNKRNVKMLRTDLQGAVIITSDGENIELVDWKDK